MLGRVMINPIYVIGKKLASVPLLTEIHLSRTPLARGMFLSRRLEGRL